ncbi:hypothetical protein DL764_008270 [Monosporascus ibericus]|uniref:Ketosynthase family 3 (KS3) domain-containing protein n=1 Tax=Monosporascus ibericus TaxID=155417 RepID=A0A4Q4T066_9PEZI|nr:hypothetical protein DL764_008270 [Monosporascus ibericus]
MESPGGPPPPIAVVIIGLRLPGKITTTDEFWELLVSRKSTRSQVPQTRYNIGAFHSASDKPGTVNNPYGHYLDCELDRMDASFFSMSKPEVDRLDPQQRLLLEVVWECMESGGQRDWRGGNIGCYVGVYGDDCLCARASLIVTSMTIRTGCSLSLVGLHEACQAIYSGACGSAVVAGTSVLMSPTLAVILSEQGVLSPTGSCNSFDARADGYARGEAVNAVYIKKLSDAMRDGDPIRGVIRATGVNFDGKTRGITNPSCESQEALIRKIYQVAGISFPGDTGFVECHGTGTTVGDPLEVTTVGKVFGNEGVFIGSVKPNVGHSEGASGITSMIKAILALEHETIPPNINFAVPNPKKVLLDPEEQSKIQRAEFSQPICTAVQIGLVNPLSSWNVKASAVVGHSSGEIAAAYTAGSLILEAAIIIAYYRGQVAEQDGRAGGMATVALSRAVVASYLQEGVVLVCENSPGNVTLSGDSEQLDIVMQSIKADRPDCFVRRMKVEKAYHPHHMREIGAIYQSLLEIYVTDTKPSIPFYSTVTGKRVIKGSNLGPSYWRSNLESPVLFSSAVRLMLQQAQEDSLLLEVGPHSALSGPLRDISQSVGPQYRAPYVPTLIRKENETKALLKALGQLFQEGVPVDIVPSLSPNKPSQWYVVPLTFPSVPSLMRLYYSDASIQSMESDLDEFPAFPNANFDYGYGLGMRDLRGRPGQPKPARASRLCPEFRRCDLAAVYSELGEDDHAVVDGIEDAKEFIEAVLAEHPIRPFLDLTLTLTLYHLCHMRDIRIQAATTGWTDTMDILVFNITEEHVKALRIIGDATGGFGSFPKMLLLADLDEAGLSFLLVEPGRRIIPRCWKLTCDKKGIQYHKVTHTMRGGDWDDDHVKQHRGLIHSRGLPRDLDDVIPSKPAATSAFETARRRPKSTVDDILTDRTGSLNPSYRIWAIKADIWKIAKLLVEEMASANLLGGPIEGLVLHLIKKTFARLGVRTKSDLHSLVGDTAAVQAQVADALSLVEQNEANTESKLSDINRRLDDVMSKLAGANLTLLPYGTDPNNISSTSPMDWSPSATQPSRWRRGPSQVYPALDVRFPNHHSSAGRDCRRFPNLPALL